MNYITISDVLATIKIRSAQSHKGSFGSVLTVGGSEEYRGAAALCCMGAMRCGVGLVTLAAPEIVINSVAASILETIFLPLPSDKLFEKAEKSSCVAFGCGLLPSSATMSLAAKLLPISNQIVLDAGGLISLKDNLHILGTALSTPIITPHPKEMAQLCSKSTQEVIASRENTAISFAAKHNVIVVLKGNGTIIASPTGEVWQNSTGNSGLAKGGSGDILTGMIAAFCATGLSPIDGARCGVFLHGYAADLCAARLSMTSMQPQDILQDLASVFAENTR